MFVRKHWDVITSALIIVLMVSAVTATFVGIAHLVNSLEVSRERKLKEQEGACAVYCPELCGHDEYLERFCKKNLWSEEKAYEKCVEMKR